MSGFAAVATLALALSGCGGSDSATPSASAPHIASPASVPPSPLPSLATVSDEYRPGLGATVYLPEATGPADLVVLVPGGGWETADPTGLIPLAEELAANGTTTVTMTYSTTEMGATFPTPVDDVVCAVRWAAKTAADNGRPPERVIVFGHSAGGHLAALAATTGGHFGADCADPEVAVDGLIGVAGVYDITWAGSFLNTFFGGSQSEVPDAWNEGDPMWWAQSGKAHLDGLHVLLVHGDEDATVPVELTTKYADALTAAGNTPEVVILPRQNHNTIYLADVIAPTIETWLAK